MFSEVRCKQITTRARGSIQIIFSSIVEDSFVTRTEMNSKIIDSHFHIFDLDVRRTFPNQNVSHGFPEPHQKEICRFDYWFSVSLLTLGWSGLTPWRRPCPR